MKKLIIAAALVISATGITALSLGKTSEVKRVKVSSTEIEKAELGSRGFSLQKNDLGSAD